MTRRRRRKDDAHASSSPGPRPSRGRVAVLLALVAVAATLAVSSWRSDSGREATGLAGGTSSSGARTADPVPLAPAGTDTPRSYRPLLGEWRRPDGDYVLSVQAVGADGAASVQYFNPRPIRVARAVARREGDGVGLFVEFDDVNYPGSTYTLAYDSANDSLQGVYYQAVQGARYDVVFVRAR